MMGGLPRVTTCCPPPVQCRAYEKASYYSSDQVVTSDPIDPLAVAVIAGVVSDLTTQSQPTEAPPMAGSAYQLVRDADSVASISPDTPQAEAHDHVGSISEVEDRSSSYESDGVEDRSPSYESDGYDSGGDSSEQ